MRKISSIIVNEENQQPRVGWSALTYDTLYFQSRSPRWKSDVMHVKRRKVDLFRRDTFGTTPGQRAQDVSQELHTENAAITRR